MVANGYCTLAGFKEWVGLTDNVDDATIDRAIVAASRGIDNFCRTQFWQTASGVTRVFDTADYWRVRVGDVVAVTQVATDSDADGVFETVWTAADWQLLPLDTNAHAEPEPYTEIRAIGTLTFPRPAGATSRQGLVQVTGTWGWPAIPEPVVQATMLLANRLRKRKSSPEGVAGFDEFGTIRISARDDPDAVRYLTPYKTSRRKGGWALA